MAKRKTLASKLSIEAIELSEPKGLINNFRDFCASVISPAINELKKIKGEKNRRHLQKLLYTNIVDRYDHLIDKLLLWMSVNNEALRSDILNKQCAEPINKKEVYELFLLKEGAIGYIGDNIRAISRASLLRDNHSQKVRKIMASMGFENIDSFRVNNSNGHIIKKSKKHMNIPNSILGFSDWLYCRRNSIVHGDGVHYTDNDLKRLKGYKINLSARFRISIASLSSAFNFYIDFLQEYEPLLDKCIK